LALLTASARSLPDEILCRLGRQRGIHGEQVGHLRQQRHGREVLDRVERQAVKRHVDRDPAGCYQQRVQILSLTMFETTPLDQLLRLEPEGAISLNSSSQLNLFQI
jgi:hypothetical protein